MTHTFFVTASYGRSYKTQAAVLEDWNSDKDFKIISGPYINKTDAIAHGVRVIFDSTPLIHSFNLPTTKETV